MLFNSFAFVIFYAIVYVTYWALRRHYKIQNGLLLVASYVFYGWWDVRFLYLIIMTTAADFCYGLMIDKGVLKVSQRMAASFLMLFAAFFFVTVQWSAVHLNRSGLKFDVAIDWSHVLPADLRQMWILLTTALVVGFLNILYPLFIKIPEQQRRTVFLCASLFTNLATLGFFKYYNFFAESFRQLLSFWFDVAPSPWTLNIVLPVGVSFFTFQSLSYTIDVYRKHIPAENSLTTILTCLAFFPQLVAGPIERAAHLLPQFHRERHVTAVDFRGGLWLILWGFFQKLVVADNAAAIVNSVFRPFDAGGSSMAVPDDGLRILIAVYAFALQIFGDFSGYSDIARGTARLLGFDIMLNFNLPYFAISPSDFWRRWHISLSTWLRDYLYIPLGGNRNGTLQTYRNLFLTMLIGGLWHGAAWTYVLWGVYHGCLLMAFHATVPWLGAGTRPSSAQSTVTANPGRRSAMVGVGYFLAGIVMFHLTCLGWLFFRAQNVATISLFLKSLLLHPNWSPEATTLAVSLLSCSWFLILFQVIQAWQGTTEPLERLPRFVRFNIVLFVAMSLATLSAAGEQTFIYFAF